MQSKFIRLGLFAAFVLFGWSSRSSDEIIFIVNATNSVSSLTTKEISTLYFKQLRDWPDGTAVRFIDHKNSSLRSIFLKKILKKTQEEVDRYWIGQKLYSGDSAPVQSSTDQSSIYFVSQFKGAIGYIAASTTVNDKNVKIIKVGE